jgi:hypothetical protein
MGRIGVVARVMHRRGVMRRAWTMARCGAISGVRSSTRVRHFCLASIHLGKWVMER